MALSREDKADVKGAMGKAIANKISNVTRDKGRVGYEAGPRKNHTPNGRKQSWYSDPKNSPF